ncbi:MAG: papain-like cysteine protease family protein, partial [Flammeovirgaceae bacterium]
MAVYSMMKSWQSGKLHTKEEVAEELGDPWLNSYKNDTGLSESSTTLFQIAAGLKSEPPANYIPLAYKEFLENYGPLWITTGNGVDSHARLLVGIYGNTFTDLSTFAFIDPKTGNIQKQNFQTFF